MVFIIYLRLKGKKYGFWNELAHVLGSRVSPAINAHSFWKCITKCRVFDTFWVSAGQKRAPSQSHSLINCAMNYTIVHLIIPRVGRHGFNHVFNYVVNFGIDYAIADTIIESMWINTGRDKRVRKANPFIGHGQPILHWFLSKGSVWFLIGKLIVDLRTHGWAIPDNWLVAAKRSQRSCCLIRRCRLFLSFRRRSPKVSDCSPADREREMGLGRRGTGLPYWCALQLLLSKSVREEHFVQPIGKRS